MIHFDFIVNETDAENIINLFQNEITNCLAHQRKAMVKNNEIYIKYWGDSIKYYEDLKDKISKSSKCE